MRRLCIVLLAMFLVGCAPVSATGIPKATVAPSATATPVGAPRIVFIGDSLTEGAFATRQDADYVVRVTYALHATQEDTQGHYGWTVANTITSLIAHPAPSADIVVVELGTNDVGSTPVDLFSRQYAQLLSLIRETQPANARWACLSTWRDPSSSGAYDSVIQSECPGTYVPIGQFYMNGTMHGPTGRVTWLGMGDWFHPNDKGHQAIAQAVETALASK